MVTTDTPQGNVDLGEVESWVRLIHGDSQGFVHICSTLSWSGQVFDVTDAAGMESLKRYVQRLHDADAKGIYMRATTIGRPLERDERGSVADSVSLPGFWADIDIAGPGHKTKKPLPPDQTEAARIVVEAGLPEPTLWVHSGGGLYPWWLFENPVTMVSPEIVDMMQDLSTRWQDCLVAAAERLGYSYGGVGDLARVLRVPGTWNRKTDAGRKCTIIWDGGERFADEHIEAALEVAEERRASFEPEKPMVPTIPVQRTGEAVGDRPGDDFNARVSWEEILEPAGYQFDRRQGEETYWVRPGKDRRDGHSCTTNYRGSDLLYVFSTEMDGFESNATYSKFATWAILNGHGTDLKAASRELRSRGFGAQRPQPTRLQPPQPFQPRPLPEQGDAPVQEPAPIVVKAHLDKSDLGNAARLVEKFGNQFRCVGEERRWWAWTGQVWTRDAGRRIDQAAEQVTEDILGQGWDLTETSEEHQKNVATGDPEKLRKCKCVGCEWVKFGNASRSDARVKGMISRFGGKAGIGCAMEDFDKPSTLVTVTNGVLDPETRELYDFDPRRMMTRQMPVAYDASATAPRFEQFMAEVLPNPAMRDYVQRALGYTLLGENDQRVIFQVYGPSGTGKSQFLNIFEGIFGGFGTTAPETALRETRSESSFELHSLKGKRFVTTSETSESAVMNEALIKRLTGRDNVTTRGLYESPTTWTPECVIWLATNFAPKMNSDDAAIWARVKAILFDQQFSREKGTAEPDLGKKILAEEASGILNWLLEGVRKYREAGLGEPTEVTAAVEAQRLESDNVAQFVYSGLDEGRLVREEGADIQCSVLYRSYVGWCRSENYAPLGQRRFNNRVEALGFRKHKRSTYHFLDLRLTGQMGLLGTMG